MMDGSVVGSLGTHCACQFTTSYIRTTGQRSAFSFNWVQQYSVMACTTSCNVLSILVYADKLCGMRLTVVFGHQVSPVLSCPSRGTQVSGRDHNLSASCGDMANSAWGVVMVQVSLGEWILIFSFIFCTVHIPGLLVATGIPHVPGGLRKADIVRTSTCVSIVFTSNTTFN